MYPKAQNLKEVPVKVLEEAGSEANPSSKLVLPGDLGKALSITAGQSVIRTRVSSG